MCINEVGKPISIEGINRSRHLKSKILLSYFVKQNNQNR